MDIREQIERFRRRKLPETPESARVYFQDEFPEINDALERADEDERFSLAVELFRLWIEAGIQSKPNQIGEAGSIFGQFFYNHGAKRLIYILSENDTDLGIWYGVPMRSVANPKEIGRNQLFGVYGEHTVVVKYLEALLQIHPLPLEYLKNGKKLYGERNCNH